MNHETKNVEGQEPETKIKAFPSKWKKAICYVVAGVVLLLLFKDGCSIDHIYEFDGGVINLSNVTIVKTGMRFNLRYRHIDQTAFSIGYDDADVPITKENIAKIKESITKFSEDSTASFSAGGRAYIEFDGKSVKLQQIEEGWNWRDLESTVDSWLDETKAVLEKIK